MAATSACGVLLVAAGSAPAGPDGSPLSVETLRVNTMANPIGLGDPVPSLSWRLSGGRQAAYEVRVASSAAQLDQPDLWDSGKVSSSDASNIAYAGAKLASRKAVTWDVRVWGGSGAASGWSAPATWEVGLLANSDWSAKWIESPDYTYATGGVPNPLPIFAKPFQLAGQVTKARLHMTGLGQYAAQLNGKPVGDAVLEPGQTSYFAEVDYRTYDVTSLLEPGDNLIGVETGSGAYQRVITPGRYFFQNNPAPVYGTPKVIAELDLTYADGTTQTINTDSSWQTKLGPTTFSAWWAGEDYDARRLPTDWTAVPALSGSGWRDAALVNLTSDTTPTATTPLIADPRPPVTVAREAHPVAIKQLTRADIDTTLAAAASPSDSNGTINISSTGASATNQILYRYTLSGSGTETWHSQFTYNGFRYLQVTGLASAPTPDAVTVQVTHASNRETASFDSSSDLLDQIYAISKQALENNMQSVLTDCPDREKGPYTGDNLHNIDTELTLFDMQAYEGQLVNNMRTAQRPVPANGQFPGMIANIAPEYHFVPPGSGGTWFLDEPNWGGAVIMIPWNLYEVYGDTQAMRANYDAMVKWLDWEATTKAANNGNIRGLGDWSAAQSTTAQAVIDYGYYRGASAMAKIAALLGKTADAGKYAQLTTSLAAEYNTKYLHTDASGNAWYANNTEAANAVALDTGLVPARYHDAVVKSLVAAVHAYGDRIGTGSVALGPLFRTLHAARSATTCSTRWSPTPPRRATRSWSTAARRP